MWMNKTVFGNASAKYPSAEKLSAKCFGPFIVTN